MRFRVRWPRFRPRRAAPRRLLAPLAPDDVVEVVPATRADIAGLARVFSQAFADTVAHVFGRPPAPRVFRDIFLLCYRAEPAALWVARHEGLVVGYVFAPSRMSRLYRRAMLGGHLWRWALHWVRGEYGFGLHPLRAILLDKFAFLRGSLRGAPGGFPEARILSVGVDPLARGRGIAGRLLDAALGHLRARGAEAVRLEVRPENEPAVRLYRRRGFEAVGVTGDTRGPWLVMELRLR